MEIKDSNIKLGVIGGTFDPIHLAHTYIAYEAKERLDLDEIIFMPAGNPPHKTEVKVSDSNVRLKMVEKAIEGFKEFSLSTYEIEKNGLSYTYETLAHLKKLYNCDLFFITGGDCLINLEKWKAVDKILSQCTLVVFTREEYPIKELEERKEYIEKKYNTKIELLKLKNLQISSTMIRERIKEGKRVDFFLNKDVLDIIMENNLYGEK